MHVTNILLQFTAGESVVLESAAGRPTHYRWRTAIETIVVYATADADRDDNECINEQAKLTPVVHER